MGAVRQNLLDRHLNLDLHRPIIDEEGECATFYIWNLSGQLIGYQQYRPFVTDKKVNDPKLSRYFTYCKSPTICLWGLESLHLRDDVVFLTEGIFDAARLTFLGFPALAALSCDPKRDTKNFLKMLNRRYISITDNDPSGRKLAKFGRESYTTPEKDLGDSTDAEVRTLLHNVGF